MRLTVAALFLLASAAVAQGQTPLTGTTGPLGAAPPGPAAAVGRGTEQEAPASRPGRSRAHRTLQERFDEANTTHDGHLTLEQARTKMPAVARDFVAIDTGNKGYVTVDEIKDHSKQLRSARRAARRAAKTP